MILAFASLRAAGSVTGSRHRVSAFLTPGLAAGAMAATIVLTGTTVLSALLGLLAYPIVFLAVERALFAEDFALYRGLGSTASATGAIMMRRRFPHAIWVRSGHEP